MGIGVAGRGRLCRLGDLTRHSRQQGNKVGIGVGRKVLKNLDLPQSYYCFRNTKSEDCAGGSYPS